MTTLMSRIGQLVGTVIKDVSARMLPNDVPVPHSLLPPATSTQLGAVKPGAGLSVAADGTLQAPFETALQQSEAQWSQRFDALSARTVDPSRYRQVFANFLESI